MSTPIITINVSTFQGKKLSFSGTVDFQGGTGNASYYLDPVPSGTPLGPFALPLSQGAFSVSGIKLARGQWKVRVVATADAGDVGTTNSTELTSNRGVGSILMPLVNAGVPPAQEVVTPILDIDTQAAYSGAIANAPTGAKQSVAASTMISIMDNKQVLQILNGGIEAIRIEYTGSMNASILANGIAITTSNVASSTIHNDVDITTGHWSYVLMGGPNLSLEMRGTVGVAGSDADIILPNTLTTTSTLAGNFTIAIRGVSDPVAGSSVVTLSGDLRLAYTQAILAASVGAKRMAGANVIASALCPKHALNIFRDGSPIINVGYLGDVEITDDGINVGISLGIVTAANVSVFADINSGSWTFNITGGQGQTEMISGTVGPVGSDANIFLSESPSPGRPFLSTMALVIPRSIDGLA